MQPRPSRAGDYHCVSCHGLCKHSLFQIPNSLLESSISLFLYQSGDTTRFSRVIGKLRRYLIPTFPRCDELRLTVGLQNRLALSNKLEILALEIGGDLQRG